MNKAVVFVCLISFLAVLLLGADMLAGGYLYNFFLACLGLFLLSGGYLILKKGIFKIENKVVVYISLISLLGVLFSGIGILVGNYSFYKFFSASSALFILSGGYLLVKNGTFIHSKEARIARLGISILLIGVMFKIMHWPYANILLGASFLVIFVMYAFHFINKTTKSLADWGKVAFLAMELSGSYFKIMHMAFADFLLVSSLLVLIALTIQFIYINRLAL